MVCESPKKSCSGSIFAIAFGKTSCTRAGWNFVSLFEPQQHTSLGFFPIEDTLITQVGFHEETQFELLKYCNFEEYSKCILLMYPKGDVLFLHRDVTIVFGHHRVVRFSLHCKSGQQYPNEYNIILFLVYLGEVDPFSLVGLTCQVKIQVTERV